MLYKKISKKYLNEDLNIIKNWKKSNKYQKLLNSGYIFYSENKIIYNLDENFCYIKHNVSRKEAEKILLLKLSIDQSLEDDPDTRLMTA